MSLTSPACLIINKASGSIVAYNPSADTNAARWTALKAAAAAAVSGDAIQTAPGTFDMGTDQLALGSGVNLYGAGNGMGASFGTLLTGTRSNLNGVIVNPAGNNIIRDLFIQGTAGAYSAAYASCIGFDLRRGDVAGDNVTLINVGAKTSGIALSMCNKTGTFPTATWNAFNSNFIGNDDCTNIFGADNSSASAVTLNLHGCSTIVQNDGGNPKNIDPIDALTCRMNGAVINEYGGYVLANPGPASVNQTGRAVETQTAGATINLYGTRVVIQNDGTSTSSAAIKALGNGTINIYGGCTYDRTQVFQTGSGTVNRQELEGGNVKSIGLAANGTVSIPAGYMILGIAYEETGGDAITALIIGTTNGGNDVAASKSIASTEIGAYTAAQILKRIFSSSVATTLFINASDWAAAALSINFVLARMLP